MKFQFSITFLFCFITASALAVWISTHNFLFGPAIFLVIVIFAFLFLKDNDLKRYLVCGGVIGVVVTITPFCIVAFATEGQPFYGNRTLTSQDVFDIARMVVFPVGMTLEFFAGLAFWQAKQRMSKD